MGRSLPLLAALLLLALAPPAAAQRDWNAAVIQPQQLADGLWMLSGVGGNLLLCTGPDGALLVDTQYAPLAGKIRAAVDSLGGGRTLRFVVNTHYHGDHVGGDSALAAGGAADRGARERAGAHDGAALQRHLRRHDAGHPARGLAGPHLRRLGDLPPERPRAAGRPPAARPHRRRRLRVGAGRGRAAQRRPASSTAPTRSSTWRPGLDRRHDPLGGRPAGHRGSRHAHRARPRAAGRPRGAGALPRHARHRAGPA